jgi:hypothetical protein
MYAYTDDGELQINIPSVEQPYDLDEVMGWIIRDCVGLENLELCSSFCRKSTWFEQVVQVGDECGGRRLEDSDIQIKSSLCMT